MTNLGHERKATKKDQINFMRRAKLPRSFDFRQASQDRRVRRCTLRHRQIHLSWPRLQKKG